MEGSTKTLVAPHCGVSRVRDNDSRVVQELGTLHRTMHSEHKEVPANSSASVLEITDCDLR